MNNDCFQPISAVRVSIAGCLIGKVTNGDARPELTQSSRTVFKLYYEVIR